MKQRRCGRLFRANRRARENWSCGNIPFFAAGITTLNIDLAFDSPSAREASRYLSDIIFTELSDILIIVGRIIIDKIIIAVKRQSPVVLS